jgi:type IV pilus assembly protein PilF
MSRLLHVVAACCLLALVAACSSEPKSPNPPRPETLPPIKQPEVSPKDRAQIHMELAAGYYERGQMDVALDEANDAAKLDPTNARVYNVYGLVYAFLGETTKAEENFRRAVALAPNDSEIRQNWGWFLCTTARARESIPEFEAAVRNPLYRTPEIALVNAGRCTASFGDVAAADGFFRRALAVSPNNPSAAYGLATLSYKAARYDDARGWMKPVMLQASPQPDALWLGVCIERKLGDRQAELSYLSQLRNRYPDAAETKAIATGSCE